MYITILIVIPIVIVDDMLAVYDRVGRAEGLIENHTSTLSSMIYQQIPRENTNITRQCTKSGLRRECKHHNVKNRPSERIQTSQENVKQVRPSKSNTGF